MGLLPVMLDAGRSGTRDTHTGTLEHSNSGLRLGHADGNSETLWRPTILHGRQAVLTPGVSYHHLACVETLQNKHVPVVGVCDQSTQAP